MGFLPQRRDKGQALLVVLLSMAVVFTVVLSLLSVSITDVAVTSREEESLRAFSAAEAGIEEALITGSGRFFPLDESGANFTTNIISLFAGSKALTYPGLLSSGDNAIFWFVGHTADGDFDCGIGSSCFTGSIIEVCWGVPGTSDNTATTPAVELSVYYAQTPGDYRTIRIARAAYDPKDNRAANTNFFSSDGSGTCTIGDLTYAFQKRVNLDTLGIAPSILSTANGLQFATLRMFYNTDKNHPVGLNVDIAGNTSLPSQGSKVESVGIAGEATRKIEVYKLYASIPSIFSTAIYSGGGLSK